MRSLIFDGLTTAITVEKTPPLLLMYTTFATVEDARRVVQPMIKLGLIACANIIRIDSLYCWNGDFCDEPEVSVILKTRSELEQKVREHLEAHHPYDTPCILSWLSNANAPYMAWIRENTSLSGHAST